MPHRIYSTLLHRMNTSPSAPFDLPFSISSVLANYYSCQLSYPFRTKYPTASKRNSPNPIIQVVQEE